MARTIEFEIGSAGEPDVGIFPFEERVTIKFHGSFIEDTSDTVAGGEDVLIEELRQALDDFVEEGYAVITKVKKR